MRGRSVVVICRNINPSLRYFLGLYLFEVSPLVFTGKLSNRSREKLVEELFNATSSNSEETGITVIIEDSSYESGFRILLNDVSDEKFMKEHEGLYLSVRRQKALEDWEKILGKTIPERYSLVRHLIDTAAVAQIVWDKMLSNKQKSYLTRAFFEEDNEDAERQMKSLVTYLAGMHDIGKASPYWQQQVLKITDTDDSASELYFPEFIKSETPYHHDVQGFLYGLFASADAPEGDQKLLELLQVTSLGHHGNFSSSNPTEYEALSGIDTKSYPPPVWMKQQTQIEACVVASSLGESERPDLPIAKRYSKEGVVLLEGIIILSDWIASQGSFINSLDINLSYQDHFEEARSKAIEFFSDNALEKSTWKKKCFSWLDVNPHIEKPNEMQESVIKLVSKETPGFMFLSAPMGMGKTEAAIYASTRMGADSSADGLYFALPTQATANAMFDRVVSDSKKKKSLGDLIFDSRYTVALLHSNSLIAESLDSIERTRSPKTLTGMANPSQVEMDIDFSEKEEFSSQKIISDFLLERKVGSFSSISVGTIDPLLNSVVKLKHNALRWLATSGKTLIIDEAHSFDSYTTELMKTLIGWCARLEIPVICMTATMLKETQKELAEAYAKGLSSKEQRKTIRDSVEDFFSSEFPDGLPSPSVLAIYPDSTNKKVRVECPEKAKTQSIIYSTEFVKTNSAEDRVSNVIANEVVENHDPNLPKYELVVVNRVNSAIDTYQKITERLPDAKVRLLHSRMPSVMRKRVTEELLRETGKRSDRRENYVLVATQIVESSLDIDFDTLHTPIAPLEAILQRVGRIFRHDNRRRNESISPTVKIYCSDDLLKIDGTSGYSDNNGKADKNPFLPYSSWAVASAYHAFKTITEDGEKKVAIKDNIDMFYRELFDENGDFVFRKLFFEYNNGNIIKSSQADRASVKVGSKLVDMTSIFTQRSSYSSPVRLIEQDIVQIIPIVTQADSADDIQIVSETDNGIMTTVRAVPYGSIDSIRFYASNVVNIPKYVYDKASDGQEDKITRVSDALDLPQHILPLPVNSIFYSTGKNGLGFVTSKMSENGV